MFELLGSYFKIRRMNEKRGEVALFVQLAFCFKCPKLLGNWDMSLKATASKFDGFDDK